LGSSLATRTGRCPARRGRAPSGRGERQSLAPSPSLARVPSRSPSLANGRGRRLGFLPMPRSGKCLGWGSQKSAKSTADGRSAIRRTRISLIAASRRRRDAPIAPAIAGWPISRRRRGPGESGVRGNGAYSGWLNPGRGRHEMDLKDAKESAERYGGALVRGASSGERALFSNWPRLRGRRDGSKRPGDRPRVSLRDYQSPTFWALGNRNLLQRKPL
jgi:hypothetical protein